MAIKQDLFNDGTVQYTYEAGNNVTLWVSGFKVAVYKPYSCKRDSKYYQSDIVYTKPKIVISTNATITLSYEGFKLIDKAILAAVQILNKEGFGLIDIQNWKPDNNVAHESENPYRNMVTKQPPTKTFKPLPGDIFIDANSNKWLYLGFGQLLENGRSINRWQCYYIYMQIDCDNYSINKHEFCMDVVFTTRCYHRVDTFKTEKRGVQLLHRHGEKCTISYLRICELYNNNYEYNYSINTLLKTL